MSGFGALDFMNKTLKSNRGLLKKINLFERIKPYSTALKNKKIRINITSTPLTLVKIRASAIADSNRNTWVQIAKLIGVFLIIGMVLIALIGGVFLGKG